MTCKRFMLTPPTAKGKEKTGQTIFIYIYFVVLKKTIKRLGIPNWMGWDGGELVGSGWGVCL